MHFMVKFMVPQDVLIRPGDSAGAVSKQVLQIGTGRRFFWRRMPKGWSDAPCPQAPSLSANGEILALTEKMFVF